MDSLSNNPAPATPDRLADFCRVFLSENRAQWPPDENRLATRFVEFFNLHFTEGAALKQICRALNIEFSEGPLPKGVKGYNHCYHGKRTIIIATDQSIPYASFEHTLLHELRELVEYVFRDLGAETSTAAELEKRAERFASSVRVTSACNVLASLLDDTHIETTWKRWLAYLVIAIGGLFYAGTCAFLPEFEDHISKPS